MSCICNSPVRPDFKDSYNDLLDKPKINGVTLSGNLTAEDLGIKAGASFKIVTALPTTDIDPLTIYLVPAAVSGENNFYQEFIYINNAWEKVGEPITMDIGATSFVIRNTDIVFKNSGSIRTLSDLQEATESTFNDNCYYKLWLSDGGGACVRLLAGVTITGVRNIILPGAPSAPGIYLESGSSSERFSFSGIFIVNGRVYFDGSEETAPFSETQNT